LLLLAYASEEPQRQHLEIVRDIAVSVNAQLGNVLKVPQALIRAEVMTIPGLDGRKMSKNYRNTIPIFADPRTIRRQVMRIVTDSKPPEQPKDPEECNVFAIWQVFAPAQAVEDKRQLYWRGGLAYSDIKQELYELLIAKFDADYQVYQNYMRDTRAIDRILKRGAVRARVIAEPLLSKIRSKIGLMQTALQKLREQGGQIIYGGQALSGGIFDAGTYVAPCIAEAGPNLPLAQGIEFGVKQQDKFFYLATRFLMSYF
jgi:hypothetical protein